MICEKLLFVEPVANAFGNFVGIPFEPVVHVVGGEEFLPVGKGWIRFDKILCRALGMDAVEGAEGKTSVGYSAFLGYDKDFKINEEQAKAVKLIYKLFLGGRSFYAITKELEKRGIKSPSGKDKWHISTVRSILTNEKYRGDALIQKEYTADFLDKTRRKNTGEIPQYYVE